MAVTRDLIGLAKGIVMERYKPSPDAAFQLLVATSQKTNRKLQHVCEQLTNTGELAGHPDGATGEVAGASAV